MTGNPFAAPEAGLPSAGAGGAPSPAGATTDGQGAYSVEYELQIADLVAFQVHLERQLPQFRRRRILQRFILPSALLAMAVVYASLDLRLTNVPWIALLLSLSLLLFVFGSNTMRRRTIERSLRRTFSRGKHRMLLGWHRVTIDPAGLREASQYSESFVRWTGVERVDTSPQHVLIYLSSAFSVLIPKLAFRDQGQLDAFVEAAQRYHRAAEQSAT